MGFTSYKCAKSAKPILHNQSGDYYHRTFCRIVVLFPNGDKVRGEYDGYGRVDPTALDSLSDRDDFESGSLEIMDAMMRANTARQPRLVLAAYYEGEKWGGLSPNEWDPGQGHFYGEDDKERLYGLPPEGEERKAWHAMRAEFDALELRGKQAVDAALAVVWPLISGSFSAHEKVYQLPGRPQRTFLDRATLAPKVCAALLDAGFKMKVDDRLIEAYERNCLAGHLSEGRPSNDDLERLATFDSNSEPDLDGMRFMAPRVVAAVIGAVISEMDKRRAAGPG